MESKTSRSPAFFKSKRETNNIHEQIKQLKSFITHPNIQTLEVGSLTTHLRVLNDHGTVKMHSHVYFLHEQELEQLEKDFADQPKKLFAELLTRISVPLTFYLNMMIDCLETQQLELPFLPLNLLTTLVNQLDSTHRKLFNHLNTLFIGHLKQNNEKFIKACLEKQFPIPAQSLSAYLIGCARHQPDIDIISALIKNCNVNKAYDSLPPPLMQLLTWRFVPAQLSSLKKIIGLLIDAGVNLETTVDELTAYERAKKRGYPEEILQLIKPPSYQARCNPCAIM